MNEIETTIKSFLKKYSIDKSNLTYLVAFSGGFDSMCLLNVLKNSCKNKIIAIHLNHKWRGAESDFEEDNCLNFCKKIGVEFYSECLSSEVPHTETAARDARYDFFYRCSKKFSSDIIFTAHNKNDNAETLIYRLAKGTGISGLCGINEKRDIFFRPLLNIKRNLIEKYCIDFNLSPNSDSSNLNTLYKRNYIRSNILPMLENINPNAIEAIYSLSEIAKEESKIVEDFISSIIKKNFVNNKFCTENFVNFSPAIQNRIIYKLFNQYNIEFDRNTIIKICNFISKTSKSKSGKKISLNKDLWIFVNSEFFEFITLTETITNVLNIQKEGTYLFGDYIFELEDFNENITDFPNDNEFLAYINLTEFPLEIRTRKNGDKIQPLGLKGSQKLKKYLNEKKIPNHIKDSIPLLVKGKEILWVPGVGISEKIKVCKVPTHRIKCYKNN